MRLLDARKFEFVEVNDANAPPYAILSHTWGDEEVTFQEMRRVEGKITHTGTRGKQSQQIANKKGFAKIRQAATVAVQRGLDFIWVDTCCIDKTSSSELSEAINSMYRWYQRAAECYAILSDVDPASEDNWLRQKSQLRCSRWFTRGWTLQELIAPASVLFFACDWSILGHKDEPKAFAEVIGEVTGIDLAVLDGSLDPAQLSVATRMKWASGRQTTRLEDSAYCLMGLFQVNMPLLYGEGDHAFARLQEEIIQRCDDQSLFAWNASSLSIRDRDDGSDPDQLCGLMAKFPAQFGDPGELQLLPPFPEDTSVPSAMTNLGLRVQLYLRPIHKHELIPMEEDYYAILNCVIRVGDQYLCPAIPLRRLSKDQYARLQTRASKLLVPPPPDQKSPSEGYRTVYVRQDPFYYHIPRIRVPSSHSMPPGGLASLANSYPAVTSLEATSLERSSPSPQAPSPTLPQYVLVGVYPSSGWNPHMMTMTVEYSRELKAMAVFRFRDLTSPHGDGHNTIDVVVGLRRQKRMDWEGWCLQLSRRGLPALSSVLDTINREIKQLAESNRQGAPLSAAALRYALGDDHHLLSDASVTSIQLHGRSYVSISMTTKHEMSGESIVSHRRNDTRTFASLPRYHGSIDSYGDLETKLSILIAPPVLSDDVGSVFSRAALRGDTEAIRILENCKPGGFCTFDEYGRTPLWWAAAAGKVDNVNAILSLGRFLNSHSDYLGLTPLHIASRHGHLDTVKVLLNLEFGPSQFLRTHGLNLSPMDLAALFGHREVIEELVEHLDDAPDDALRSLLSRALHIAASCGHLSCVKILLAARADPLVSYDYYLRMKDLQRADATVVERRGDASFAAAQEGFEDVVQEIRQLQAQQTEQPLPGHRFVPRPPGTRYTSIDPSSLDKKSREPLRDPSPSPQFNLNRLTHSFFKPVDIPTANSDLDLRERGPTTSFATKSSSDSPVSKNPFWPNGAPDDLFGDHEQLGKKTSTNPFRNKSKNTRSSSSATDDRGNKTISEERFWAALGAPVVPISNSKDSTSAVTTVRHELDGKEYPAGVPTPPPPLRYEPSLGWYVEPPPTGGFEYKDPHWELVQMNRRLRLGIRFPHIPILRKDVTFPTCGAHELDDKECLGGVPTPPPPLCYVPSMGLENRDPLRELEEMIRRPRSGLTFPASPALLRRNFTSTASGAQELDGRECLFGIPPLPPPLYYEPPMDAYLRTYTGGFQYRNSSWAEDAIREMAGIRLRETFGFHCEIVVSVHELDGQECRPGSPTLSPPLCYDPPMDEYLRTLTGGFQYRNPPWAQDQIKQEEVVTEDTAEGGQEQTPDSMEGSIRDCGALSPMTRIPDRRGPIAQSHSDSDCYSGGGWALDSDDDFY